MTKKNKDTLVEDLKTLPYFLLSYASHNLAKVSLYLSLLFLTFVVVLFLLGR